MTKSQVIALLIAVTVKAQRFNSLLPALASKMPGSFAHHNRKGYSASGLSSLEYDVKRAYGISSGDLRKAERAFAKAKKTPAVKEKSIKNNVVDLDKIVKDQQAVFTTASEEVKKEVKLRERYPFLNKPETPHIDKFYQLVGINGTAYNSVLEARKSLFSIIQDTTEEPGGMVQVPMSNEEIFDIASKAIEDFELNLEGLEELDYYRDNGEILGKHKIFADVMLEKKVASLSPAAIQKRYTNLKGYVNRELGKFKKSREDAKKDVFADKIVSFEKEIRLIEAVLQVSPKDAFASKLAEVGRVSTNQTLKGDTTGKGEEE